MEVIMEILKILIMEVQIPMVVTIKILLIIKVDIIPDKMEEIIEITGKMEETVVIMTLMIPMMIIIIIMEVILPKIKKDLIQIINNQKIHNMLV